MYNCCVNLTCSFGPLQFHYAISLTGIPVNNYTFNKRITFVIRIFIYQETFNIRTFLVKI